MAEYLKSCDLVGALRDNNCMCSTYRYILHMVKIAEYYNDDISDTILMINNTFLNSSNLLYF